MCCKTKDHTWIGGDRDKSPSHLHAARPHPWHSDRDNAYSMRIPWLRKSSPRSSTTSRTRRSPMVTVALSGSASTALTTRSTCRRGTLTHSARRSPSTSRLNGRSGVEPGPQLQRPLGATPTSSRASALGRTRTVTRSPHEDALLSQRATPTPQRTDQPSSHKSGTTPYRVREGTVTTLEPGRCTGTAQSRDLERTATRRRIAVRAAQRNPQLQRRSRVCRCA